MYSIFKTGVDGEIAKVDNLREGGRYLPDNIYKAIEDFKDLEVDRGDHRIRCSGPVCRTERSCRQPLSA